MELNTKVTQTEFSFDLATTPVVEKIHVVRNVSERYDDKGVVIDTTTKYRINCSYPYYISVDCTSEQLPRLIELIQFVIDNPPA